MSDTSRFSAKALQTFASELLKRGGATDHEAEVIAESLIEANLRGHDSHGVFRVVDYVLQIRRGEIVPGGDLIVLDEGPARIVADGARVFGQVQARRLLDRLIPKAREQGLACGTMRNCGHVGRLAEWVERAARQGFAGLIAVNDNGVLKPVAPPGGLGGRISTNPIALGMPTSGEPMVLDISTSAVAAGKVRVARLAGTQCPPGWLQDAQGNPTTDPNVLKTDPPGAMLPFGGDQSYKAFGLALLFDILVSGLSGGFCPPAPEGVKEYNNVVFVIWDPARWAGRDHFLAQADRLIAWIRDTPTKPGVDTIQLPGDRSGESRRRRLTEGIPLPGGNWSNLERLAKELKVACPQPMT